jgi:predicted  nucleic acid-binding Zn-ribbon protein
MLKGGHCDEERKKWSNLSNGKKIEWLRGEIDRISNAMPRTAARTTKRLTDSNHALSNKIGKLSAKVSKLAKELQEAKAKSEDRGATSTDAPAAPQV